MQPRAAVTFWTLNFESNSVILSTRDALKVILKMYLETSLINILNPEPGPQTFKYSMNRDRCRLSPNLTIQLEPFLVMFLVSMESFLLSLSAGLDVTVWSIKTVTSCVGLTFVRC